MKLEELLEKEMLELYQRAGREAGYWGNYYLRSVKQKGGLTTAKNMLVPLNNKNIHKGLRSLIDAQRADLSLEWLVLRPEFASLFSAEELAEAQKRISSLPANAVPCSVAPEKNYPDEVSENATFSEMVPENLSFIEGTVKQVKINVYERSVKARKACLKKYGYTCAVCGLNFETVYGARGRDFIHVHHRKPVAATKGSYKLDPIKDLVPVCPNCHAMLHTQSPPLSVQELRDEMKLLASS